MHSCNKQAVSGIRLARLFLVLMWTVCVNGEQPYSHKTLSKLKKSHPGLSYLGHKLYDTPNTMKAEPFLTDKELKATRYMLRFVPFTDKMAMRKILAGADAAPHVLLATLNAGGVVRRVREDTKLLRLFHQRYTQYVARQKQRRLGVVQGNEEEERAYEECGIDYDAFITPITNLLANLIIDDCSDTNNAPPCKNGTLDIPDLQDWAIQMIDAMGKIPEGILEGKLYWAGAFEYCQQYRVNYSINGHQRQFDGQYARIQLLFPLLNESIPLLFGVCAPSTCTDAHIMTYITKDNILLSFLVEHLLGINIGYVYTKRDTRISSDRIFIAAVVIFTFLFIIVVVATIYDGFFRKIDMKTKIKDMEERLSQSPSQTDWKEEDKAKAGYTHQTSVMSTDSNTCLTDRQDTINLPTHQLKNVQLGVLKRLELFFVSFSAYSNLRKIFSLKDEDGRLAAVDGVRVLSYLYLCVGMTGLIGPIYTQVWNTSNLLTALTSFPKLWYFNLVINFFLSMDSFLFLAGLLMALQWLRKYETEEKMTVMFVLKILFLKWWRVWPTVALTALLYVGFARYAPNGPFVPDVLEDADTCSENWWPTLLLVNNLVRTSKTCMLLTPRISMLMQLHVASLFVLVPLVTFPIVGYLMLCALYVAHIGSAAGIYTKVMNGSADSLFDFFYTPWCSGGPYIIGVATGILLYHYRKKPLKIHIILTLALWVISLGLILITALITYDENREGGQPWTDSGTITFNVLGPSAWALGVAIMTVLCEKNLGGAVNSVLTLKMWLPLSRVTFQAYMLLFQMLFTWVFLRTSLWHMSIFHLLYIAVAHWFCSLGFGVVFSIFFQYPFSYGSVKAVICDNIIQWIKNGRYSKNDLDSLLQKMSTDGNEDLVYEEIIEKQTIQDDSKSEYIEQRL